MVEDIARVHLYDQRGSGRSSSDGPFDIDTFVADLDALRDHWGRERWIVGGHSWGAVLALFYAFAHPERTLSPKEREELEGLGELLREGGTRADQDRFLRLIWSTDFATREAASVLDQEPLYAFPRSETVARAMQEDWKARFDAGIEDDLRKLRVPVLVLPVTATRTRSVPGGSPSSRPSASGLHSRPRVTRHGSSSLRRCANAYAHSSFRSSTSLG